MVLTSRDQRAVTGVPSGPSGFKARQRIPPKRPVTSLELDGADACVTLDWLNQLPAISQSNAGIATMKIRFGNTLRTWSDPRPSACIRGQRNNYRPTIDFKIRKTRHLHSGF